MMFASDLDRTIIYSTRALESMNILINHTLVAVETKNGENVAFMTERSFQLLKEVANQLFFVPVTTRTFEQYERVFIFKKEIKVSYSVSSNGAVIYYKGKKIEEWKKHVAKRLEMECLKKEMLLQKLERFSINGTLKIADNLFIYYILKSEISREMKEIIVDLAKSFGWKVSLQGRKLYFMPLPVCKGEAMKFIQNREGIKTVAGAGDSVLDFPLLEGCTRPFIPSHGELAYEREFANHYYLTKSKGVLAGEEIIEKVHQLVNQKVF
ncbi:hypothetical protein [Niallia sp. 01092]|uniref:hypothetical protein n=1 Tax=unclassified Niallia TaxID=2837522 RepID=UPI003FD3C150